MTISAFSAIDSHNEFAWIAVQCDIIDLHLFLTVCPLKAYLEKPLKPVRAVSAYVATLGNTPKLF